MRSAFSKFLTLTILGFCLAATMTGCKPKAEEQAADSSTPATATEKPAVAATAEAAKPTPATGQTLAVFETSMGNFTARLFTDKAPKTAQNFIDLAEGKKAWLDPATSQMVNKPLYDGRKIFRIYKQFMFQTGSATDNGAYQPGFTIPDEPNPELTFSKPGMLAMANTGSPNSAACQFFVTTGPEWHGGDGTYTIFGEVIEGMETVMKIDAVPTDPNPDMQGEMSLPKDMPIIKKVTIKHGK